MHLNKYLFCFFILNYHFLFSQVVNIENKRNYDDTVGFNGSIDANCSAIKTKDLIVNLFFRPRVQYKSRNHYYLIHINFSISTFMRINPKITVTNSPLISSTVPLCFVDINLTIDPIEILDR